MPITSMSSREFNQDRSRAKQATKNGPVYITDRGRPAHVLLTFEDYRRLAGAGKSLIDALAMPDADKVEFDPPKLQITLRPADFS
jgi:hypothetical protein